MSKRKIVIIGAVAGGATCAARARRLSEEAEILLIDRGPYVSFANCGLPYYIGEVIPEEENLLLVKPDDFRNRFNIDVRILNEAVSIDTSKKEILIKDIRAGKEYKESYDSLVLATGSQPVKPPLPGIDMEGIFSLRNIPDSNEIKNWIKNTSVQEAVVVGGGLIGLEMTENLVNLGITVSVVEMLPNVIPFFDPEMAVPVHEKLREKGVNLYLNTAVKSFSRGNNSFRINVTTNPDKQLTCDMVILSIGSRPENNLAHDARLESGEHGGVRVNEYMQTSDSSIWAVGDLVESRNIVTGEWTLSLLASPANRQARIAADSIFGRKRSFRGVQSTAVCRVFDMDIASTGASEKNLKQCSESGNGIRYEKVYLHPRNHAEYYPGSSPMALKLIFSSENGRILGAQAVGQEGVEKRIDVIAMDIQLGATVFDLEEAELSYAPQFGSAKEVVNLAGMAAANILRGDVPTTYWETVDIDDRLTLDVREPEDFTDGHAEGATNVPLGKLRTYITELDKTEKVQVYCTQGKTSYYATRVLLLNGFDCINISGGYKTYQSWKQLGDNQLT
ncbi:MAG: FAD-dependent oxidoreductase [Dehalococcoidales bacterium]|nr:MAG: FAD-dependent oxidoreductase [Dehalococcoidales bacterium]